MTEIKAEIVKDGFYFVGDQKMRPKKQDVLKFQEGDWKYASKYPKDLLLKQGRVEEF